MIQPVVEAKSSRAYLKSQWIFCVLFRRNHMVGILLFDIRMNFFETSGSSAKKRLQKYQKSLISFEIRLLMELLGRFELPTSSLPTAIRPFYRTFSGVISCYCILNEDFPELQCSQIILFYPVCFRIVPRKSRNLFPNCSQSDNLNRIYLGYIYYLIPLFPILYRYQLIHNVMSNKFSKTKYHSPK